MFNPDVPRQSLRSIARTRDNSDALEVAHTIREDSPVRPLRTRFERIKHQERSTLHNH